MGLQPEKSRELIFSKELSLILFLCFLHRSFTSDAERTFVALLFARPMTQKLQKLLNLVKG
jgi:hypothetical protein